MAIIKIKSTNNMDNLINYIQDDKSHDDNILYYNAVGVDPAVAARDMQLCKMAYCKTKGSQGKHLIVALSKQEEEKVVADKNIEKTSEMQGKKIAVVGSGPAGLTCASFLARSGAEVTIYEKYDKLGGILRHGIPDFRLEKDILDKTIEAILDIGIKVEYNKELGRNINLEDLEKEYNAIFLGFGANIPSKMNIEGEELEGVYGGNSLLETGNHPSYKGKKVAVIGGGNVAMDCSRTIKRLGGDKVYVIYRRAEKQMPAEIKEIEDAKNEGIEFLFQNNIVKILGDSKVEKIECIKTELVKKEGETREVPVNIEGSNYEMDIDYVVMAVGSSTEKELVDKLGLRLNKWGNIDVNEKHQTSKEKIYAGGDAAGDKGTVAWAARAGREAAEAILSQWGRTPLA